MQPAFHGHIMKFIHVHVVVHVVVVLTRFKKEKQVRQNKTYSTTFTFENFKTTNQNVFIIVAKRVYLLGKPFQRIFDKCAHHNHSNAILAILTMTFPLSRLLTNSGLTSSLYSIQLHIARSSELVGNT